jgi:hypothetical protein
MTGLEPWRVAYARQARADLQARDQLLADPTLPESQQLHFLQMACEKLCKAHLCAHGVDPDVLRRSHAFISVHLPTIALQQFARKSDGRRGAGSWVIAAIRSLARRIELLAPSVDDGGRIPANCEYPWVAPDGSVRAPCDHHFAIDLLYDRAGRHLLKVVHTAITELIESGRR